MTGLHWIPTDADGLRWELWLDTRVFCGRVRLADVGRFEALWASGFSIVQVERGTLHAAACWVLDRVRGVKVGRRCRVKGAEAAAR